MGKYWIFDFDGTLVDSEKPIRKCYQKITMSIDPSKIKKAEQIIIGPTLKETTKLILGSENINQYEKELVEYLAANNQDMLNNIASSGKLDDSNEKELQSTLDSFTKTFNS